MKQKNIRTAWIILGVYLTATVLLLVLGYSLQKPRVARQEFPFTITYSYQGKTETISDVYVAEYERWAKYIGDGTLDWYGYVKDRNRLESYFYRIGEEDGMGCAIDLNLEPGYLMGDPRYADSVCRPTASGFNDVEDADPGKAEELGLVILDWEYPEPIENRFFYGGISMSSQATLFTTALAVLALGACVVLIRKDPEITFGLLDKVSIVLNLLAAFAVLPFIFIIACLSEILGDVSFWQQLLYLAPAVTALGIAASVTLRRMGRKTISFWIQFAGPALLGLVLLMDLL